MHPEFIKSQFVHNKGIAITYPGTSCTKLISQGTGLGLSLTYDIVTKGHGRMIEFESRPGEGSEFIILNS